MELRTILVPFNFIIIYNQLRENCQYIFAVYCTSYPPKLLSIASFLVAWYNETKIKFSIIVIITFQPTGADNHDEYSSENVTKYEFAHNSINVRLFSPTQFVASERILRGMDAWGLYPWSKTERETRHPVVCLAPS